MVDKLNLKIDGFEATFEGKDQVKVVSYLLQKEREWRTTANTFRKAIDLIYEDKDIKK